MPNIPLGNRGASDGDVCAAAAATHPTLIALASNHLRIWYSHRVIHFGLFGLSSPLAIKDAGSPAGNIDSWPMMSRWTDGEVVLPLPAMRGHVVLEIHLAGAMTFVEDAVPAGGTERRAAA